MILRKLNKADYPELLQLCRALDEHHVEARPDWFVLRDDVFPREHYDRWMDDPEGFFMGAFDGNGTMTGYVRATLWQESGMVKGLKNVCLDDIYVLPEYRRRGIARRLCEAVENWAREMGALRLELHVWDFNRGAMELYRSMGMTPQRYVLEKKL